MPAQRSFQDPTTQPPAFSMALATTAVSARLVETAFARGQVLRDMDCENYSEFPAINPLPAEQFPGCHGRHRIKLRCSRFHDRSNLRQGMRSDGWTCRIGP